MDDITKAIHGARAALVDRIRQGMSNANEVLAPEGEIKKGEDAEKKDIELFLKACGDDADEIEKEKGKDARRKRKTSRSLILLQR